MRLSHLMLVAGAGIALCVLGIARVDAMTGVSPTAMRAALPELNLAEAVHCRPYLHRHRFSRVESRGCSVGVVVSPRSRLIVRGGVRVREGISTSTTVRSITTTRSGAGTTVRGSSGTGTETGGNTSVMGGGQGGGATTSGRVGGGASTSGGASGTSATGSGGASVGGSTSGGATTTTTPSGGSSPQ